MRTIKVEALSRPSVDRHRPELYPFSASRRRVRAAIKRFHREIVGARSEFDPGIQVTSTTLVEDGPV